MITRFFSVPKLWPAHEQHVRRVGWIELFYDLVFAAAISQLGTPFEADYSFQGLARYAFLLALVFWRGLATRGSRRSLQSTICSSALSLSRRCFWSR